VSNCFEPEEMHFLFTIWSLLGHIVCKQGLLVDPSKIAIIVDLPPPTSVKQLRTALGHTGYYRKFIKGYAQITTPMEKVVEEGLSV
jgi:hypothetical protein